MAATPGQATRLTADLSHDGVRRWMQSVLAEDQYAQAIRILDEFGERPDGDSFLGLEAIGELESFGLTRTLAQKLYKCIQTARRSPEAGSEDGDDAAGASGRPKRGRPKRSAQKRAASPAEDAAEEEPEANPRTVPKRPRGRPRKSTAAEAEPAQAEGDEEMAAPAGGEAMDCAVELSVGAAAHAKKSAKKPAPAKRGGRKAIKKEPTEENGDVDMADATDNGAPAAEAAAAGEQDGEAGAAAPVAGEAGAAVAEGGVDINEDDNEVITVSSDSDEEMEEGRRQGEPDSDYMPSDDEPAADRPRRVSTRSRRSSRVMQEEAAEDIEEEERPVPASRRGRRNSRIKQEPEEVEVMISDSEDDVIIEEEQVDENDVFFLPRPENEKLPDFRPELSRSKAEGGMRLFLECLELEECKQVARTLGLNVNAMSTYQGRRRDKFTGEYHNVTRKRTLTQWRKQLLEELGKNLKIFDSEIKMALELTKLADDEACRVYLIRYLENCFRVHPPIEDDGSNLPEVLMQMWSNMVQEAPPSKALLGVKTIYIQGIDAAEPPARFRKDGLIDSLWANLYSVEKTIKINEKKHNTPEERAVIKEWLKNALGAGKSQTKTAYKLFKHRNDWFVQVRVVMSRPDVIMGMRDKDSEDQGEQGEDNNQAPVDIPDAVAHLEAGKLPCDLLFLYRYMDAATDPKAPAVTAERVAHCGWLKGEVDKVKLELEEAGVIDEGQSHDGLLSVSQVETLLNYCEGQTYPEATNAKHILRKLNRRFPFKPFQKQALNAILREETSTGTGRHLWVEVPAPDQEKYDPVEEQRKIDAKMRERAEGRENRRGRRRGVDSDEDSGSDEGDFDPDAIPDDEMGGDYMDEEVRDRQARRAARRGDTSGGRFADDDSDMDEEEYYARQQQRQEADERRKKDKKLEEQRAREDRHHAAMKELKQREKDRQRYEEELGGDGLPVGEKEERDYYILDLVRKEEERAPGVRPNIRLFYSPLLNAFYWGTNLKDMQQPPPYSDSRVKLFLGRGNMLCLEVGLGKTAVALAAAAQPRRSTVLHCHKPIEEGEWRDDYHYEGMDGRKGYLYRGGTLVIAPKTLLPQWERVEIVKFRDEDYMANRVLNSTGVQGKRKPTLPSQLAEYDMVLINAETIQQKHIRPLYESILWERVIVDEAHQEPGLITSLLTLPKRSLVMLTGTPISNNVADMADMLKSLCMPPWGTLAKSAYNMGYVLQRTMIRYTKSGTQLTGEKNLELPELHINTVMVPWDNTEKGYYEHLAEGYREDADDYVRNVRQIQAWRATQGDSAAARKMAKKKNDPSVMNPLKVIHSLRPLRHACSGGVAVEMSDDTPNFQPTIIKADPDDPEGEPMESYDYRFKSKIRFLLKRILKLRQDKPDDKMVIFSCFADTLAAIEEVCSKEKYGLKFRTMKSSDSMKKRSEAIDSFMNDPPTTIFLLSTTLASVGLTLIAANHLFLVEPSLNPPQEQQAIGRIYRMGQTKEVFVERLVMEESVESRIVQLIEKRKARNRANELATCAHTKAKAVTKKKRNDGEDVSGVCQSAKIEELLHLFKPYTGQESESESEEEPEQDAQANQDAAEAGEGQEGPEEQAGDAEGDGADAGDHDGGAGAGSAPPQPPASSIPESQQPTPPKAAILRKIKKELAEQGYESMPLGPTQSFYKSSNMD